MHKKKSSMFTGGSSTSATFVLPVRNRCSIAEKEDGRIPKSSIDNGNIGALTELQMRYHCDDEQRKARGDKHAVWSNDEAEASEASVKVSISIGNSH